ncbi:MAG TPA: NAD(P)-binding domain-containing protein [Terriglobales bacterium]|nr:NAD(P)-binding domain-containing protein [Terriglobales bacterium]
MPSIGLIGLGNAGVPVAERILARGYPLTVFDIDATALNRVVQQGARAALNAAAAVSDITLILLPSAIEVRQAIFGLDGVLSGVHNGSTVIDLSGTDPDCARELQERLGEKQASFIGGTIHANGAPALVIPQGRFSIVIGGQRATLEPAAKFLNQVAQTIICLPEPWMPKAFKIAIILYATTNNIITAEICSWLAAQGADPKIFLKLLQTTGSQASATRMEEFLKRKNNNGGALSNSYKDFRQALSTAAKLEIPMPLASMANQIQEMGRSCGFTRLNSPAAMGELYELLTGVDLSATAMDAEKKVGTEQDPRVVYLTE